MNTYITVKTKPGRRPTILKGAATLTFDHSMRNHRVMSDKEALESDWSAICRDMNVALKVARPKYELDAA